MKALTVREPYASLIALGMKHFETRSWQTKYRGDLAIHASVKEHARCAEVCRAFDLSRDSLRQGEVVAVVSLEDCIPVEVLRPQLDEREILAGDFSPGRFGWKLGHVRSVAPGRRARGSLGLWTIDDSMLR